MNISQRIRQKLQFFPKAHLIVFASLILLLILGQCSQSSHESRKTIKLDLSKHQAITEKQEKESPQTQIDNLEWHKETVKSGDSLSKIFKRQGLSSTVLHQVMSTAEHAKDLLKIYPGHELRFGFNKKGQLQQLEYITSKLQTLTIEREDDENFNGILHIRQAEVRIVYRQAIITDSLSMAAQNANIPLGTTLQLANILSGVVDFIFDVRKNDSFDILYEEKYLDGEKIATGNILAASYTNEGETYTAFRYEYEDGRSGYYSPKGISMRKPFLRAPLDFTRVSSGFNLRRRHPIHKKIKAHRGIDYVAPRGTPIYAVADGRVRRSGFSKANGNYVFLTHPGNYETKYLHLQRRYVKTGQKVKQRDTIGTLGSTGYSTGPHLHYEFLVNGVHRNPKTIFRKLPSASPIPKPELARFQQQIKYIQLQYENHQQAVQKEQ